MNEKSESGKDHILAFWRWITWYSSKLFVDDQYAFDSKRNLYKTILWISIHYKYKKESIKILSFIKIEIIVEKYRINFVIFHNGLLGGVNSNSCS